MDPPAAEVNMDPSVAVANVVVIADVDTQVAV